MLGISLVHQTLLLIDQLLFELLLPDLLELHFALDLPLNALLLLFFAFVASLLLVGVSFQQCLILLFLPVDAVNGLTILSLLLGVLFGG